MKRCRRRSGWACGLEMESSLTWALLSKNRRLQFVPWERECYHARNQIDSELTLLVVGKWIKGEFTSFLFPDLSLSWMFTAVGHEKIRNENTDKLWRQSRKLFIWFYSPSSFQAHSMAGEVTFMGLLMLLLVGQVQVTGNYCIILAHARRRSKLEVDQLMSLSRFWSFSTGMLNLRIYRIFYDVSFTTWALSYKIVFSIAEFPSICDVDRYMLMESMKASSTRKRADG